MAVALYGEDSQNSNRNEKDCLLLVSSLESDTIMNVSAVAASEAAAAASAAPSTFTPLQQEVLSGYSTADEDEIDCTFLSGSSCQHSAFTLITSNQGRRLLSLSPPPLYVTPPTAFSASTSVSSNTRRKIFSSAYTQQHHRQPEHLHPHDYYHQLWAQQSQDHDDDDDHFIMNSVNTVRTAACPSLPPPPPLPTGAPLSPTGLHDLVSPLASPQLHIRHRENRRSGNNESSSAAAETATTTTASPLSSTSDGNSLLLLPRVSTPSSKYETPRRRSLISPRNPRSSSRKLLHHSHKNHHMVESVHAQSLLLGVAFCAIWTPSNLFAPNLTQIAQDFELEDATQRDLYFGAYCSLAMGVLSLPISAVIGMSVDSHTLTSWTKSPRKLLLVWTTALNAVAALLTGLCRNRFWHLFFCRLFQGGFMAASVPIVFSFLSDMFATAERNAASSGLTAMMGMGILAGQVYAGSTGELWGWRHSFYASCGFQCACAIMCAVFVKEPTRGAKEQVLQELLNSGSRYDRRLTLDTFVKAMVENASNAIILWQGFFSSLPWGIIFCFLNDYLSQERGFTVPDATFLVLVFGIGCTLGGVLGGYVGGVVGTWNLSYLPLFMAVSTALGIFPFYWLLNSTFTNPHSFAGVGLSLAGGLVASLPSVNVRPILINVNLPETRGASLTAANLLIQLGRGLGPSCVTLMTSNLNVSRQFAFNFNLIAFWIVSAIQFLFLARTLPRDQETMEQELASYAREALARTTIKDTVSSSRSLPRSNRSLLGSNRSLPRRILALDVANAGFSDDEGGTDSDAVSEVGIQDRMTTFDGQAARQTIVYVAEGIRELGIEIQLLRCSRAEDASSTSGYDDDDDDGDCSGDCGSSNSSSSHSSSHALVPTLCRDYGTTRTPNYNNNNDDSSVEDHHGGTSLQILEPSSSSAPGGEEDTESTPLLV